MANELLTADSSSPLYEQVIQHLRTEISSGSYQPGQRMPSEAELCRKYGVSRITVRRAVHELADDGFLETRQGKGIYVSEPKIAIHAMALNGFTGFSRARGGNAQVRILKKTHRFPSAKEARLLEIPLSTPVCELARVLIVGGIPTMYDRSIFSEVRFPGMLERVTETTSTYELMATVYGHNNVRVDKEITMTIARPDEAEYLSCKLGENLFCIEKVASDQQKIVNHLSILLCVASRVKLTMSYEQTDKKPY